MSPRPWHLLDHTCHTLHVFPCQYTWTPCFWSTFMLRWLDLRHHAWTALYGLHGHLSSLGHLFSLGYFVSLTYRIWCPRGLAPILPKYTIQTLMGIQRRFSQGYLKSGRRDSAVSHVLARWAVLFCVGNEVLNGSFLYILEYMLTRQSQYYLMPET